MILWNKIKEFSRPGTIVYVMDLIRAESKEKAKQIVETVSGNESETLKQDFYNSLLAAFTLDEIKQQLTQANLDKKLTVEQVSERHFIVKGKL